MKEINITEADIVVVAAWIKKHSEYISNVTKTEEDSLPPAVKVIRCVLSLRTSYDKVVVPREKNFRASYPDIKQVIELSDLMGSYTTPCEFIQHVLNFNSERKAKMLQQVVKFVCEIIQKTPNVSEENSLRKWAIHAKPQECYSMNIKYFKVAGFQYLRMLFGADTTKPDVHINSLLLDLLTRVVPPIESILLLEAASKREGFTVRDVDSYIWIRGARGKQNVNDPNLVRLDPDIADAFPTEKAVNKALRSVLKEIDKKE